jgi:hypothetical protein
MLINSHDSGYYKHDPSSRAPSLHSAFWVNWWLHATPAQVRREYTLLGCKMIALIATIIAIIALI